MKINHIMVLLMVALSTITPPLPAASGLPESVYERVSALADQADGLLEQGRFLVAAQRYRQALALLPKPLNQWTACTWLTISLGDSYFFAGQYRSAQEALNLAMTCPGAQRNPYARMRMGQVLLELGQCEQAADELTYALLNAGFEVFEGESPKYLEFVGSLLSVQQQMQGPLQC